MQINGMAEVQDFIGRQHIYSKAVKGVENGQEEVQEIEFVRTKKFFSLLKETGLRSTEQPYEPLIAALSLEGNIYNQGLMISKLASLLQHCESMSHFPKNDNQKFDKDIVNEYSAESRKEDDDLTK